jgi:hypothetical protein
MAQIIRMLENREGAYDHINIVLYREGEVYSRERTDPPISQDLLDGFVASGHAIEVDAQGNPIGTPASRRQTKPTGPIATKADTAPPADDDPPAPSIHPALAARLYPAEDEPTGESPKPDTSPVAKK